MLLEDELPPSAARLVESLRDTGYTFTTSVADIVDNCVAADATNINIKLELEFDGSPILMIADNGSGMNDNELVNAMTYGSPKRKDPKSLGKFGMGLKTASTSFCKKLTVISRKNEIYSIRQWDLDKVILDDKWMLLKPDIRDYEESLDFLKTITNGGNGTIVIWENIDRLVRTNAEGTAKGQIKNIVNELQNHLSGVFYNFLEKGNETPDVTIKINDEELLPWDPFCRWMNSDEESRVEAHINKPFEYTNNEGEILGTFYVNIYLLPNKTSITKEESEKMRYGLDNQGFHVFRENRMISSGGWPNRLFVKEPHLNLIRVEFSFDHKLDDLFQIDIKKSRIDFPKELRDKLKKIIAPARNEANIRYRTGNQKSKGSNNLKLDEQHDKSSNAINKHHTETTSGSQIGSTDKLKGEAEVKNKFGVTKIKLNFDDSVNRVVQTRESLQDGVLWMPGLIEGNKHAVFLSESHEFYKRFYYPNRDNTAMIVAMDSLLWSLAEAELSVVSDNVKRNLEDLRISVSRSLRTLSEELPDISESENIDEGEME
jgi:hypothetical protein